jgi:hypothetical protein
MWNERDIWLRHNARMAQLRHEAYVARLCRQRCEPRKAPVTMGRKLSADSKRVIWLFVLLVLVVLLLPLVGCISISPPLPTHDPRGP